jgi:cell division septal protein FtsQ
MRTLAGSRVLAAILVVAMSGVLAWFFVDLSFYVYDAKIQGAALINAEDVYLVSKLHEHSIFYISRGEVKERIRSALPGLRQVDVQCTLPNVVTICIEEQDVRFLWHTSDQAFWVDGTGRVLRVDDGSRGSVLSVVDLDNRSLKPGDRVPLAALEAVEGLQSLLPEIKTFEYSDAKGISLYDARGWRIVFGDSQSLPEKVASMHALLQKIASLGEAVELIDLRFVGSPYYQ